MNVFSVCRIERQIDLGREELRVALSARSNTTSPDSSLPLPPLHHRGSSDFLNSSSGNVSRSHSPHQLRNRHDLPTRDEDYIEMAQEEEQEEDERREERDDTPVYADSPNRGLPGASGEEGAGESSGPAERRKAILQRLGLKGVSHDNDERSDGRKSRRRWGEGQGDGESGFSAESGGESAGSLSGTGLRRRYSMGSVGGGRPRNGSLSTDDEGWR